MSCGSCGKNNLYRNTQNAKLEDYDLTGGVAISSLNNRQIEARLEVFKRKFCNKCKIRYDCNYVNYLNCKGLNPK